MQTVHKQYYTTTATGRPEKFKIQSADWIHRFATLWQVFQNVSNVSGCPSHVANLCGSARHRLLPVLGPGIEGPRLSGIEVNTELKIATYINISSHALVKHDKNTILKVEILSSSVLFKARFVFLTFWKARRLESEVPGSRFLSLLTLMFTHQADHILSNFANNNEQNIAFGPHLKLQLHVVVALAMTSLRLPADAAVGTHTRSNPIESPHP